jgi:hypothetical protein
MDHSKHRTKENKNKNKNTDRHKCGLGYNAKNSRM